MATAPPIYIRAERESRLSLKDVNPHPQEGQYWVRTDPLSLHRVTWVEGDGATSMACVGMEEWGQQGYVKDWNICLPLENQWVYLHHSTLLEPIIDTKGMRIGDVYIHSHTETLVFAAQGPSNQWAFYSDVPIVDPLTEFQLFQRGPTPEGMNVWDHMEVV